MKNFFLFFALLFLTPSCKAQNTLQYTAEIDSPKATLQDVEWISGTWRGEAMGGQCEEFWDKPSAGTMMFCFKFIENGKVVFYELGHIAEVEESLVLEIKHFGPDLKGWEKQDEVQQFKLVKTENNRVYFNQFTFEKIAENEINIYVVFEESGKEMKFNYKRM